MTNIQNAITTAKKISQIAESAKRSFIERDEAIDAISAAIVCGQHCVMLGKPGTAKSALINYFSQATNLSYFKTTMNPDLLRDDLVGPIDPNAFSQGVWNRVWTGLAVSTFAFIDETGQGNGQTLNMLVDAMEERETKAGAIVKQIPLTSLFGASNEHFEADSPKVWDRFLVRVIVNPVTNDGFISMLRANIRTIPNVPITQEELENCILTCREMALNFSPNLEPLLDKLHRNFPTISASYVSDRRWQRIMQLAAAQALLDGCVEIKERHLKIARFALWTDPAEIDDIAKWLSTMTDKEERERKEMLGKLAELQTTFTDSLALANGKKQGKILEVNVRVDKLISDLKGKSGGDWSTMLTQAQELKERVLSNF